MITPECFELVLEAARRGESLIAVGADKRPWYGWKRYQSEPANLQRLATWGKEERASAFAVVTGAVSEVVVLDFDEDAGRKLLARLGLDPHVRTGRGGYHLRLQHPGFKVATQNSKVTKLLAARWPGLDIRGDGGYAIEWGRSEHGDYEQLRSLAEPYPIDALPTDLAAALGLLGEEALQEVATGQADRNGDAERGSERKYQPGHRHRRLTEVGGAMAGRGESEQRIYAEFQRINAEQFEPPHPDAKLREVAHDLAERYGNATADLRAQLTSALKLDGSGIEVTGAEKHGSGVGALCVVQLSNGEAIEVDRFRDLLQTSQLTALVIEATGAVVGFKAPECALVASLVTKLARRHTQIDANDLARDWGIAFLGAAEVVEVQISEQQERYAAFKLLDGLDPPSAARREAKSIAAVSTVLRDSPTGTRYVHSNWFLSYVRREVGPIGSAELVNRMSRVGWGRRGKTARIKATSPSSDAVIPLPMYLVPDQWEQAE